MNNRRVYHARGKVLGGSSSINGMIFQRATHWIMKEGPSDQGMSNGDYSHCLPYFKRMENCLAGGDAFRGDDGPLKMERGPCEIPCSVLFLSSSASRISSYR
ncbi:MAG: hypothetical protein Ct9H300mP28_07710 [Pseudomonadota bacterium]|nr:MAG: hypothetical protein Ct9H300mP28_07710 [Pseudomonadota bacterium]